MTATSDIRPADGEARAPRQSRLHRLMHYIPLIAPVLLWTVPCWVLLYTGQHWPLPVTLVGTVLFALGLTCMPLAMVRGHGRRQQDRAAIIGDTLLGTSWVLFTWSVLLGVFLRLALTVAGVGGSQERARIVTWAVLGVTAVLLAWGYAEARRVPRVRRLDVQLLRLGAGLDGIRVVLITNTHYGPLDRARWSARVCETVNALEADLVCHTGDIVDGGLAAASGDSSQVDGNARTRTRGPRLGNVYFFRPVRGVRLQVLAGTRRSAAAPTLSASSPTAPALIRLADAVLAEQNDEWTEARGYMELDLLAKAPTPPDRVRNRRHRPAHRTHRTASQRDHRSEPDEASRKCNCEL
ncbi:hypothetical protein ACWDZ8_39485 [Streptomyces sp. NPDC003233]